MSILSWVCTNSANHLAGRMDMEDFSNQWRLMAMVCHLPSSAMVRERSCVSVFAVTIPVDPIQQDATHISTIESHADFPIPRPEEMAR